jgi:serine/threonine protein kinase
VCIVSPYVGISVLEIITAPLKPSEAQVACIAGQAS